MRDPRGPVIVDVTTRLRMGKPGLKEGSGGWRWGCHSQLRSCSSPIWMVLSDLHIMWAPSHTGREGARTSSQRGRVSGC